MFTLVTIATIYNRSSVVTSLINDYLIQYDSAITCIDFSLNSDIDLVISRLCIDSPHADVVLSDTLITWRFEPSQFDVDNISEAISAINIAAADVRVKKPIQIPEAEEATPLQLNNLPSLIRQQFHKVAQLSIPIDINVQTFVYQPFSHDLAKDILSYQGKLSMSAQQLMFSLTEPSKGEVISLKLNKKTPNFNAQLSANFAAVNTFLLTHKATFPVSFQTMLSQWSNENWMVAGHFESEVNWHDQRLQMNNKFTDFSLKVENALAQEGAVSLNTSLAWQANLDDDTLQVDFTPGANLHLAFDQGALIKLLTTQEKNSELITFLTDNAMDSLSVEPTGSITVDFAKQTINSAGVDFDSKNLNEAVKLSLNDIGLTYLDESAITVDLQALDFSFAGKVQLTQLSAFSERPVKLNIAGAVAQSDDFWQLQFAPSATFELSQLTLPTDIAGSDEQVNQSKPQPSLKTLLSHWQGTVTLAKGNTKLNNAAQMSFDLQIDNQLKQLKLHKVMQLSELEVKTDLSGSFNDIVIKTKVIADKLAIASAQVTGDIYQPHIEVQAKDVLITDLLALKIIAPIEMKLIDGILNYQLSTQIKNTDNFLANPITLALSIKDITGEVDGTWLQELNWQQKFIFQHGQIKSVDDKHQTGNNLSIAKIETATPITNLSTKTFIEFKDEQVAIQVNNTSGHLLGGQFDIQQAQWPFSKDSPVEVKLTKIDLEKLLELDKQQGIVVTGQVSGTLPIYYDGEHFLIKEGGLYNVGDGLIQVYNNPAVEELKASSTELQLAFDALENLHYHHLSSDVSMANDGYMLLVTAIKGKNPDLDNDVNLNLNLSYDLLGLLESLNITEHFESKVIKGLQR